jgi:hypothetical protein
VKHHTYRAARGPFQAIARRAAFILLSFALGAPAVWASCGSAVCSVNTDWAAHGAFTEPGGRVDIRAEYVPQDQPRHGDKAVDVGEVPAEHHEVHTWNRNVVTTVDYAFTAQWAVTVSVPYVDRDHKHIHAEEGEVEKWHIAGLGDARVLGRYQFARGADSSSAAGVQFGFKLPTGATKVKNSDGEEAERTLQPGTGTTDGIVGGYYQRSLTPRLGWFIQAMRQSALNAHEDFRPGDRTLLDTGMRFEATSSLALMLQFNAQWRERDGGDQAEPEESGGRAYYLSPGASYAFTHDVQMYGFYQWAGYQYVNGVQLTADAAAVLGVSLRF